jgi:hypothetical protein
MPGWPLVCFWNYKPPIIKDNADAVILLLVYGVFLWFGVLSAKNYTNHQKSQTSTRKVSHQQAQEALYV